MTARPDFAHTSPFFIHESAPGDLPDLEAREPWELPEEIDRPLFREPSLWERVRHGPWVLRGEGFWANFWHGMSLGPLPQIVREIARGTR